MARTCVLSTRTMGMCVSFGRQLRVSRWVCMTCIFQMFWTWSPVSGKTDVASLALTNFNGQPEDKEGEILSFWEQIPRGPVALTPHWHVHLHKMWQDGDNISYKMALTSLKDKGLKSDPDEKERRTGSYQRRGGDGWARVMRRGR